MSRGLVGSDGLTVVAPLAPVVHKGRESRAADPEAAYGSFFPSLLERRRRSTGPSTRCDGGLGPWVSTRKIDDLVAALGVGSGISEADVRWICAELDRDLDRWQCAFAERLR